MTKYKYPNRYPNNWNKLRFIIFKKDKYICQRCGVKCKIGHGNRSPQCHHIKPLRAGGSNNWDNLTTVCKKCHEEIHADYIRKKKQ